MKTILRLFVVLILNQSLCMAQTSPATAEALPVNPANMLFTQSDTINFDPYGTGTAITNQYLYNGAVFSGYNGSLGPIIHDYAGSYGRTLHSDNWYNALQLNFVDPNNALQLIPVNKIEFDNPIASEIDYISVDVYDTAGTIIYHYLSTSPEHVTINLGTNSAAFMVFDDSATTAYVIDNILFNNDTITGLPEHEFTKTSPSIFPIPCKGYLNIAIPYSEQSIISVYDIAGHKILIPVKFSEERIQLNCTSLKGGIYFFSVKSENYSLQTGKFIVAD